MENREPYAILLSIIFGKLSTAFPYLHRIIAFILRYHLITVCLLSVGVRRIFIGFFCVLLFVRRCGAPLFVF